MSKFLILILIAFSSSSFATQQIKETFIVDGVSQGIESNPLETLFTFEEIHLMLDSKGLCSANWRGYQGTWELKDGELFLNSFVKGACSDNPPSIDPVLFFGEEEYPVKAKWFNATIELRLSENQYTECVTPNGEEVTTGYSYDAMVYEFSAGDFVYKSKKSIKHVWQRNLTSCTNGTK
ncbi:hypothetical protein [uncultured Psychrosphaera sp.]|jgi:hypothetical protein|uniref:hypothetical protein n=1 Tax=uncultured Psychrosphaera sp. TaxID=1403522 RepID=UPI00261A7F0D|nr:hypothetical protein [uncultured Psychrosphaera sp.]